MVFPVVMHGCQSWTIKKAERWRIDVFKLWCWRKLLRVPWAARWKTLKSTLNILWRTDAEAETPILWPSYAKSQLPGKDPDAGKDWGQDMMIYKSFIKETGLLIVWVLQLFFMVFFWCVTLCDPMDWGHQVPLSMGLSRKEYTGVGCHALLQRIFPT